MEALRKVPRYSRETVDTMTDYLVTLTSCVSSFGYSYISLARMMAEKEHIGEELRMRKTVAEEAVLKAQTYLDFIGHDLTNILSPVMTRAEMISQDEHVEPWVRDNASSIVRQIERATSFVRNTRRLSDSDRNEQKRTEAADLAQVLEEAQGTSSRGIRASGRSSGSNSRPTARPTPRAGTSSPPWSRSCWKTR